ncbi:adenylyltransferase/cytidyltransferase family protein [Candidatus Micrarchaeota archaeon]|nr:adenylyltransferase/cytidyltransferase family protein [Candidatus Micrarchaeota archaeon]
MRKKLFVMQLKYAGIPEDAYHFLPEHERELLIEKEGRFFLKPEERKKIKVVLTGGVYDVLHIGHVVTLNEAKEYGDVLVVAVAKDEHIRKKGREPVHSQEYRKIMVESLKAVDIALEGFDDPKKMLEFVQPNVIVYGYDQSEFLKPEGVEIIKLEKKIDDSIFKTGKILDRLGI